MCLKIRFYNRKRIAKEDIICYKWLGYEYNGYHTPYMGNHIEIGATYNSDLGVYTNKLGFPIGVEEGLHSFSNINNAIKDVHFTEYAIVKCIIPKGSKYYIGKFRKNKSYASDTIKYEEIIIKK